MTSFSSVRDFGITFPSSSTRGLGFSMNWCSSPLLHEVWSSWWPYNFSFLPHDIQSDISFLFHTRFGMVSFLFHPRFENNSCKMILLSSSTRGLKLTLIYWYFYPPPLEVRSWSLIYWYFYPLPLEVRSWSLMVTCSLYWTYTWRPVKLGSDPVFTLESQSNLVLFRSYTWKPVKLGSVPVLHLKASQTCSSNFIICLFTWTYPSLPVWLRFWLYHAYLFDWTYNSDANVKRL